MRVSVVQRPPIRSAASSSTKRLQAAAMRRGAARAPAPAPTMTTSTLPEVGAPSAGAAARAAEAVRNDRRVSGIQALKDAFHLARTRRRPQTVASPQVLANG